MTTTLRAARARAATLLTAITLAAVLTACSADDSGGGGTADVSDAEQGTSRQSGDGGDSNGDVESPASSREPGEADRATSDDGGSSGPDTPELQRSVISSGTISLTSDDVAETRREVQRVVDAQGGQITEETTDTDADGETSYSRLVVRVPGSRFATAPGT